MTRNRRLPMHRRVLAVAVLVAAGCAGAAPSARADDAGESEHTAMAESSRDHPHFEEINASPPVSGAGVDIRLGTDGARKRYPAGQAIILHGAYGATSALVATSDGEPLTTVFLVIVRVDKTGMCMAPWSSRIRCLPLSLAGAAGFGRARR